MSQSSIDQIYKAAKFLQWYNDPPSFYRDIFKEEPYPYQAKVMNKLKRVNGTTFERLKRLLLEAAGATGKTKVLGCASLWLSIVLPKFIHKPYTVLIISGSEDQAKILYGYSKIALEDNPVIASEVVGEPLQSVVYFKDRSFVMAVPNSLKAIQGKHVDAVIIDEGALAGDFVIDDAFRIIGSSDMDLIILSGTPMIFGSKFVEIAENIDKYPEWEREHWDARDCPKTRTKWDEVKKSLPEDQFSIFWEGKAFAGMGAMIPPEELKIAVKDIQKFMPDQNLPVIAGIDWGFCISSDTELLTKSGWKKLQDLTVKEEVLCLNEDLSSEYQQIESIATKDYYGIMTNIKTRNLDILCKGRHLIPYLNRYRKSLHYHSANEHVTHHYIIRKAKYKGISSPLIQIGNRQYDTILFMKLLGWYLSKGSVDTNTRFVISQSPIANKENFREILELGKAMNIHIWHDLHGRILFYDSNLASISMNLGILKIDTYPEK